ncbi:MAG: ABC transporter ATP-binding protein/permease [Firmicutes bacterium]|nr:ABC transporter ATP-binding protein/permease [Bacillota bacterium]
MLEVKNLVKEYQQKGAGSVRALNDVSVKFPDTGMVFLLGKSGSGKSTLLNVIGGLDSFTSGEIIIKGKSSQTFGGSDFDSYRNTYIGFIFQEYNILDEFTVEKNIALALELQGKPADRVAVDNILKQVDMQGLGGRKPNQLSGGQKQRVAIARALIKDPEIIMADEPTGALDSATGVQVFETLKELSKNHLIIVVSHDRDFAETYGDRIIELKDGKILSDETKHLAPIENVSDKVIVSGQTLFIEPGHTPTKQERDFIVDKVLSQGKQDGVIISLDKNINANFKKFAKMDENGNREFFDSTKPEDIKRSGDNNFKLIKSRFKFWDSFKMGASGLKVKKVRIGFTILLAAFALTFFGVADTAAAFNEVRAMHDSINAAGDTTIGVVRRERWNLQDTWFDEGNVTQADIDHITNRFPNHSFIGAAPIGDRWSGFQFSYADTNNMGNYYLPITTGFNMQNTAQLSDFGLSMMYGTLPTTVNEVAITDVHLANFRRRNWPGPTSISPPYNITDFASIQNREFDIMGQTLTIVGVVQTNFDSSRYEGLRQQGGGSFGDWLLMDELRNVFLSGFSNSLFIHEDSPFFDTPQFAHFNQFLMMNENPDFAWGQSIGRFGCFDVHEQNAIFFDPAKTTLNPGEIIVDLHNLQFNSGSINFGIGTTWVSGNSVYAIHLFGEMPNTLIPFSYTTINSQELRDALALLFPAFSFAGNIRTYSLWNQGFNQSTQNWGWNELETFNVVGFAHPFLGAGDFDDFGWVELNNMDWQFNSTALMNNDDMTSLNIAHLILPSFPTLIAKLQGTSADRDLIQYLMQADRSGMSFLTISNQFSGFFRDFVEVIEVISTVFMWVGLGFAIFAALLIMSYITMTISYKKRDIGILRAIGARRFDIYKIFFNQSLIITFIQWLVAIALTLVGVLMINNLVGSELGQPITLLRFGIRQIAFLAAIALAVAALASFLPTRKISKLKPIDAIQNRK